MIKKLHTFALTAGVLAASIATAVYAVEGDGDEPVVETPVAYDLPVTYTYGMYPQCTVFDLNEDNKTWYAYDGAFVYSFNSSLAADDWLIFPAFNAPKAGQYKITWFAKTAGSDDESYKICVGDDNTVEAMTSEIYRIEGYKNTGGETFTQTFNLEEGGVKYIGIYIFSPKNKFKLTIKDFKVEFCDPNAPASPQIDITAVGLDASVTVTAPSATISDTPLEASEVELTLSLDGQPVEDAVKSVAPGAQAVWNVNVGVSGNHTFSVMAKADGSVAEPASDTRRYTKVMPAQLPMGYRFEPDEDEFYAGQVIDVNQDNSSVWKYADCAESGINGYSCPGALSYNFNSSQAADDWYILPAFAGGEKGARRLTFKVSTKYDFECMEVAVANTDDLETLKENIVLTKTEFKTSSVFQDEEVIFAVEQDQPIYVAFHACSRAYRSYIYVQDICVNLYDGTAPMAAEITNKQFDGGDGTIDIVLPVKNLNGYDMEGTVYADLTLDGEPHGEAISGTPGQTKTVSFSGLEMGNHTLVATTYILNDANEKVGDRTSSFTFKVTRGSGFFYTIPATILANATYIDDFVIINANEDGETWKPETKSEVPGLMCKYVGTAPSDDWLITSGIQIDNVDVLYKLTLNMSCYSGSYNESYEVFIGKSQDIEGMTQKIGEKTWKVNGWEDHTYDFALAEPGRYYIGLHACSAKNLYGILVSKFTLVEAGSPFSPAAVDDLAGDGLETGELKAKVTFTFPTKAINDTDLDATETLSARVYSSVGEVTVTGLPGEQGEATVDCVTGTSNVNVAVSNSVGEGNVATIAVKCGLDKPKDPANLVAVMSEDNLSAILTWDPVTEGANGGHCNPDGMDYYIWEWDDEDEDYYQLDVLEGVCTYTYTPDDLDGGQAYRRIAVQAYNGINSGSNYVPIYVHIGTPHELPMEDNFAGGQINTQALVIKGNYSIAAWNPEWVVKEPNFVHPMAQDSESDGGYVLTGSQSSSQNWSTLHLPIFSTLQHQQAELTLRTYHHTNSGEMSISAGIPGGQKVEMLKITAPEANEGYKTFTASVPEELMDKPAVSLSSYVTFDGMTCKPMIDSYKVADPLQQGLCRSVANDAKGIAGVEGAIRITSLQGNVAVVSNIAGQAVARVELTAPTQYILLAPGVYVVTAGDTTAKVIVK